MTDPSLLDADLLKSALAGLVNPHQLNDHPWAQRAFVGIYLSQHPDRCRQALG